MKKIKTILSCVTALIKKNFFKIQKTDIYQECEKVLDLGENAQKDAEDLKAEEYRSNYNVTTRWQTV